ncbi:hypothetical protein J1N35_039865 [Gossypium stocksii]|uniref:Uncharacterized protein n=1 Tax=Gossypium stocksii TaxID=47602 RepID=A0A9D3UCX7_9ROSI|nr:hypothetical protein J1N35_039865 [Gossypium stocksii]
MILKDNREIESTGEFEDDNMHSLEYASEVKYPVKYELLVTKRALSTQVRETEQQKENIFHIHWQIKEKVCSMIIGGDSYTNIASLTFMEKLGLTTTKQPQPYKLQQLNDEGEINVVKKVMVSFTIERYNDDVLCDVVLVHAGYILLGHLWQYNRRVIHDGFTDHCSFKFNRKSITLVPMTPKQVYEDQVCLKEESGKIKTKESEVKSKEK